MESSEVAEVDDVSDPVVEDEKIPAAQSQSGAATFTHDVRSRWSRRISVPTCSFTRFSCTLGDAEQKFCYGSGHS